jgi:molybdate transport system permease protein
VLPRWIYVPAAIGALFVVLPLIAVAANVDWPHFWSLITTESSTTALVLSLKTAAASTALWLLLGVPMALVLARDGRSAVLMSHDLLNVLTLADRVLVLETGQIIETVAGSVCGSPG